ncbi:MAG: hypothetical protein AAB857_01275 [Patescibacteria group bacterium]
MGLVVIGSSLLAMLWDFHPLKLTLPSPPRVPRQRVMSYYPHLPHHQAYRKNGARPEQEDGQEPPERQDCRPAGYPDHSRALPRDTPASRN